MDPNYTIAAGQFELTIGQEGDGSTVVNTPDYFKVSGAKTVDGRTINDQSVTADNAVPWEMHDTHHWQSDGCITGQDGNPSGDIKGAAEWMRGRGIEGGDTIGDCELEERASPQGGGRVAI